MHSVLWFLLLYLIYIGKKKEVLDIMDFIEDFNLLEIYSDYVKEPFFLNLEEILWMQFENLINCLINIIMIDVLLAPVKLMFFF